MASVSDDPNGRKRILFIGADGKRRPIRLGKISAKQADAVKLRVERLVASQVTGHPPDDETSRWLQTIDGDLREAGTGRARRRREPRPRDVADPVRRVLRRGRGQARHRDHLPAGGAKPRGVLRGG